MEHITDPFVSGARELVDKKLWDAVCSTATVPDALRAMLAQTERNHEKVSYLLNTISAAYVLHKYGDIATPATGVFITLSSRTIVTHGDYLNTRTQPDWQAFFCAPSVLEDALQGRRILDPKVMSELILIGEGKPQTTRWQFDYQLESLKQYRPDIPTVFGFQLKGNDMYISSLNPCGMPASARLDRGDLAAWVALVVRIYDCHEHSDKRFVYRDTIDDFARWTISLPEQEPFSLVPFYASRGPGRMTWAGFELPRAAEQGCDDLRQMAYSEPAAGFFKLSWQRPNARFKEGELLDRAHADGWLPGLVRHQFYRRFDDEVSMTVDGESETRQLEVLHLASLGEPLSQCRTPEHILSVAYDLLQTHLTLLERGIIHRDLSWFNVLINPRHHPVTNGMKPDVVGIPCIEQILGDPNGKPMALLTDLDHAALKDVIWAPEYSQRRERTGTAMFVARELSSATPMAAGRALKFKNLRERLQAVEKHREIFNRAFPDSKANEDFMRRLFHVLERERARYNDEDDDTGLNPDELHRAHRDVESVYWITQWCFARALPKDRVAFEPGTQSTADLAAFCDTMLSHTVGRERFRPLYLNTDGCAEIFHNDLQHFGGMFSAMATYLSIPWHVYLADGSVKIDHAHHALRRILLHEIIFLRNEGKEFNVELDTTQPRIYANIIPLDCTEIRYLKSSSHRDVLEGSGDDSAQVGSKRKADQRELDLSGDNAPSAKKVKTRSECEPGSAVQRFHMVWDALRLWFGTGQRK